MDNSSSFLKQFWKDKQMVGAVTPSSRSLGMKMIRNLDFENARVVVELGPGTGVFTGLILEKMHPDAALLVFELNDLFYNQLKNKFIDPRVHFIHDTAEKIEDYLVQYNLGKADLVISSLPLTMFPTDLRVSILQASNRSLNEYGKYVQFQYSLLAKKQIKHVFNDVKIGFTLKNFPPAFIYTCKKQQ